MGFTEKDLENMGLKKGPDGTYYRPKIVLQPREKEKTSVPVQKPIQQEKLYVDVQEIIIQWAGEHLSLNSWYSSKHWTHRKKQRDYWHAFYKKYFQEPYPKFDRYTITLEYNSNLDPSNCIAHIKLVEDVMQELGIIENDNKKFAAGVHILPVTTMKNKSYKIIVRKS